MSEATTLSLAWETDPKTGQGILVLKGSGTITGELRIAGAAPFPKTGPIAGEVTAAGAARIAAVETAVFGKSS